MAVEAIYYKEWEMAFALTVTRLIEAMQQPGCPVCRLERQASAQSIEAFLWEGVNNPKDRQALIASYGFCPPHARQFVAAELSNSGIVLGVNIVYEQLARLASKELSGLNHQFESHAWSDKWFERLKISRFFEVKRKVIPAKGRCPICLASEQAGLNALSDLFETLEKDDSDVRNAYLGSDGLCLGHLRAGLEENAHAQPHAAKELANEASQRLAAQAAYMKEYIRKQNWEYRSEKMTREEAEAWRKTLTFFTGYSGSSFSHLFEDNL
jgi:hypothetical protein